MNHTKYSEIQWWLHVTRKNRANDTAPPEHWIKPNSLSCTLHIHVGVCSRSLRAPSHSLTHSLEPAAITINEKSFVHMHNALSVVYVHGDISVCMWKACAMPTYSTHILKLIVATKIKCKTTYNERDAHKGQTTTNKKPVLAEVCIAFLLVVLFAAVFFAFWIAFFLVFFSIACLFYVVNFTRCHWLFVLAQQ